MRLDLFGVVGHPRRIGAPDGGGEKNDDEDVRVVARVRVADLDNEEERHHDRGGGADEHEGLSHAESIGQDAEEDKSSGKEGGVPHVDAVGIGGGAAEDDHPVEGKNADRGEVEEQQQRDGHGGRNQVESQH